MGKGVFISYNKNDKDAALNIAIFLAAESVNVWFDEWELMAGDSIIDEINKCLKNCSHFILLWSANSAKSNWVRKELSSALAKAIQTGGLRIIPVVLDATVLPDLLADIKCIRYCGGNEKDRTEIVRAVAGRSPSVSFIKAIVKKYHETIRDWDAPFGLKACPQCGSGKLRHSSFCDYEHDEMYYSVECQECGWSDWTQ